MARQASERSRVVLLATKVEQATAGKVLELANATGKTRSTFIAEALNAAIERAEAEGRDG